MTPTELRQQLEQAVRRDEIRLLAGSLQHPSEIVMLCATIGDPDPQIAYRAAWVTAHLPADSLPILRNELDRFMAILPTCEADGTRRLLLTLIERLLSNHIRHPSQRNLRAESRRSAPDRITPPIDRWPPQWIDLLDYTLEHAAARHEPPAIRVLCLKIAHRLSAADPDLQQEFRQLLGLLLNEEEKPSLRSVCRNLHTASRAK